MIRIGVTGRMASGKSTVARRFQERGAIRIDGDALGWETLRDPDVKRRIEGAFGSQVMDGAGEVDRERLGRVVFPDAAAMERLNAIVQPALLERVRARLGVEGDGVLVLDAALIATWGLEAELDGVVEVLAPEPIRVRRLMRARGMTEAAARERIAGQRLPELGRARRHWRIQNDGDPAALTRRADRVWEEIARFGRA
ncbi:MAG TPA: dephospho-CoA kinase [Candidatus Eisenbacteria bacterium]